MVSHGVQVLYVTDLALSTQFYWSIGFRSVFVDDIISVMRMKNIYIELWNNEKCSAELPPQPHARSRAHKALHIEIGESADLLTIYNIFNQHNIAIEKTCWDASSPFGEYFSLKDPDGNSIAFCSARTWSNQANYEAGCRELVAQNMSTTDIIKASLAEEKEAQSTEDNSLEIDDLDDFDNLDTKNIKNQPD